MKYLIVVLLLLVVASLFSGLYFMYRDKSGGKRTVNALTLRIALSVLTISDRDGGFSSLAGFRESSSVLAAPKAKLIIWWAFFGTQMPQTPRQCGV